MKRLLPFGFAFVLTGLAAWLCYSTLRDLSSAAFTSLPAADQWNLASVFAAVKSGTANFFTFWSQHGEHRVVTVRLLAVADFQYFAGRGRLLIAVSLTAVLIEMLLLATVVSQIRHRLSSMLILALVAYVVACMSSDAQMESLQWPFCASNYLTTCTALLAFLALGLCAESTTAFFGAILFASLSLVSSAGGVLVWPLGMITLLATRAARWKSVSWAAVSVIAVLVYFAGYQSVSGHANPTESIQHPALVAAFVLAFLGNPLGGFGVAPSSIAGGLVLAGMVASFLGCALARPIPREWVTVNAILAFVLGSALLAALARQNFGVEFALSSRYTIWSLMAWAILPPAVLQLARSRPDAENVFRAAALCLIVSGSAALFLAQGVQRDYWKDRAFTLRRASLAAALRIDDKEPLKFAWDAVDYRTRLTDFLRANRLSIFADDRLDVGYDLRARVKLISPNNCDGAIFAPARLGDGSALVMSGWATFLRSMPDQIIITDRLETVIGLGATNARADLLPATRDVTLKPPPPGRNYWVGYVPAGVSSGVWQIYAVDFRTMTACRVS